MWECIDEGMFTDGGIRRRAQRTQLLLFLLLIAILWVASPSILLLASPLLSAIKLGATASVPTAAPAEHGSLPSGLQLYPRAQLHPGCYGAEAQRNLTAFVHGLFRFVTSRSIDLWSHPLLLSPATPASSGNI